MSFQFNKQKFSLSRLEYFRLFHQTVRLFRDEFVEPESSETKTSLHFINYDLIGPIGNSTTKMSADEASFIMCLWSEEAINKLQF